MGEEEEEEELSGYLCRECRPTEEELVLGGGMIPLPIMPTAASPSVAPELVPSKLLDQSPAGNRAEGSGVPPKAMLVLRDDRPLCSTLPAVPLCTLLNAEGLSDEGRDWLGGCV